jgi:hypothetical protein
MKITLKYLLLFSSLIVSVSVRAQKKLIPVNQSTLTGIVLPEGSKQDKRLLSEGAATILLELESRKENTGVKRPEVLYLPAVSNCKFNSDSLVARLSDLGWELIPIEEDDKFVWLQKDGRYLIAYFLMEDTQSQLYFAESVTPPAFAAGIQ